MKDPDKQEVGILGLVLISMVAGILVGFWLRITVMPQYANAAPSKPETNQP